MIGMFENIGKPSTIRLSKFWPEETDEVSRSGVEALTVTVSGDLSDVEPQRQAELLTTASTRSVWDNVCSPSSRP